ncbi:MAG: class I SAM-dependent methyltransferase [Anaerolineae bacterium]|nr:class I SAM-dependent methyltransferase [Anaerolineae bacterium]
MKKNCPACTSSDLHAFYTVRDVPIQQNTPKVTRQDAYQTPRGDVVLAWCGQCGFVTNIAFDETLDIYTTDYNNVQGYSPTFQAYVDSIADMLINRYDLHDKHIIEIGHGKGDFLRQLCEQGHNTGTGYDPSHIGELTALGGRIRFVQDFYTDKYASDTADCFVARHLIEHVSNLDELVGGMRKAIGDNTDAIVFFETPDVRWILENATFWDIFYEHCSLFSPTSIARLFARHGFDVLRVTSAFEGQYMWLEAKPAAAEEGSIPDDLNSSHEIERLVKQFVANYEQKYAKIKGYIQNAGQETRKAAIWGAGAKGVTFLNTLKPPLDEIPVVVDINPNKQHRYIPGSGQYIIAPEELPNYQPDPIFIMNPNYKDEIKQTISRLGLDVTTIII